MAELGPAVGLGMAFTLISFTPFLPGLFKRPEGPHTTVKLGVGTPHVDDTSKVKENADNAKKMSFGGDAPNIALFTSNGGRIGTYHSNKIINDANTAIDLDVMHWDKKGGMGPSAYITVSAGGPDAICISHVTVLDPTGSEGVGDYRFVPGEVAKECNNVGKDYPWFPSDAEMRISKDGQDYITHPACLMIDKKGILKNSNTMQDANVGYEGFTLRLQDFSKENTHWVQWNGDSHHMCDNNARFMMYHEISSMQCPDIFKFPNTEGGAPLPIDTAPACHPSVQFPSMYDDKACNPPDRDLCPIAIPDLYKKTGINPKTDVRRSSPHARRAAATAAIHQRTPLHKMLVKSSIEEHSAVEVCSDLATVGPHFYSTHEQMFCETDTHTLYPSCELQRDADCFDPHTDRLVFLDGTSIQERDGDGDGGGGYQSVKRWSPRPGRRRLI